MAKIYATLIRKGLKTPDDVPARLRDAVAAPIKPTSVKAGLHEFLTASAKVCAP